VVASPDGRLIARAFRHEVQLLDGATAEPIGLPLGAGTPALDFISHVGFTADGRHLQARTFLGRWTAWPVAGEARPVATLARQLERVSPESENQSVVRLPSTAERAELRARDPGAWTPAAPRPPFAGTARAFDGSWVPARDATTPARLVALDGAFTTGPETVRNTFYSIQPSMRSMPAGLQKIAGVDFDIRGMAEIGNTVVHGTAPVHAPGPIRANALDCAPAGDERIAAVHLLLRPSVRAPLRTGDPMANLTLHYADGSQADVPLRAGVDLPGYGGDDDLVPQSFATFISFPLFGLDSELLSTPRLANPHPDRALRCIDMATTRADGPILLLGATLEPAPAPAPSTIDPRSPR